MKELTGTLFNITINPHPITEMHIKQIEEDEVGKFAECVIYSKEFGVVESSFLVDKEKAEEIIELMQKLLKYIN